MHRSLFARFRGSFDSSDTRTGSHSDSRTRRWHRGEAKNRRKSSLRCESLEKRELLAADLVISEFLASNHSGLADQDGDFSDWIEIHNTTAAPVSLNGWYLTDDPNNLPEWKFPNVSLGADGYLVVFASAKDRATAGSELHTNFKLAGDGEYLALCA